MNRKIDSIDRDILRVLQADASLNNKQIGAIIGRSASTVFNRVTKLRELKVILSYTVLLDHNKLDLNFQAFITLRLSDHSLITTQKFRDDIAEIGGICLLTHYTGISNVGLEVITKNKESFVDIERHVSELKNVQSSQSHVILEQFVVPNGIKL